MYTYVPAHMYTHSLTSIHTLAHVQSYTHTHRRSVLTRMKISLSAPKSLLGFSKALSLSNALFLLLLIQIPITKSVFFEKWVTNTVVT